MKKIAIILGLVIFLSTAKLLAESDHSSAVSAKLIIQELEEIQIQLTDLSDRQQKLLQDLENLKIIARRH